MTQHHTELYFYSKFSNLLILLVFTPALSALCFYSAFTWFYDDTLLCYFFIGIAVMGILLSIYSLCFLLLNGRPYIKLTPEYLEVHFYLQRKIISFEQILESQLIAVKINALQTIYEYIIVQQHSTESQTKDKNFKFVLNTLTEHDRTQFLLLMGFLYYTPLHLRAEFLEKYIKKEDFIFSNYMDARLQLWLEEFGYLPIMPHQDYIDFLQNTEFLLNIDQNDDKKDN
ncbi:MAG: hypothetical protein RSE18_17910 [Acinetobacter sp.]